MKKEAAKETSSKFDNNSFGVSSVIFGIFSILSSYPPISGMILGIISLTFSKKQKDRAPNGWSRAGKILSVIGIILSILSFIVLFWASKNPELLSRLNQYGNF